MSIYKIKEVPLSERYKLVSFLGHHWEKGHSLVLSRSLLDFQHRNFIEEKYNFIVGENLATGEYDAIIGYEAKLRLWVIWVQLFCKGKLDSYKIPDKVVLMTESKYSGMIQKKRI